VLASVELENFRCIQRASIELDPNGTGIVGPNGSGKTSLLEALYFLGHGRSFRTGIRSRLLGPCEPHFRVVATVNQRDRKIVCGAEFAEGKTRVRLAGENISSISAIAEVLPVQVIDPGVHRLIEEGAARRRRLMDWGVFHVKHEFLQPWRRYQRALAQRNAALRVVTSEMLVRTWEGELTAASIDIDSARSAYIRTLRPVFARVAGQLLGREATIAYRRGWEDGKTLQEALDKSRDRDARLKTSTVGPHRADLLFSAEGHPARDRVSRGQQKMLAAAFVLAQILVGAETMEQRTCLLLDDPAAELDVDNLGKLLAIIQSVPAQLVVTSLGDAGLSGIPIGRKFHVEQGCFTPML
jgi:DNA replication and repair protein RecF